jgi:ABC-2 type transport system ATP-binding protein
MVGMIRTEQLSKRFGDILAVDGLTLEVNPGEVFGFLGPNGAGKSTLVKVLTTILAPSSGRATVAGYDVARDGDKVRAAIGVALQDVGLDALMTARELLVLQARLFGMSSADARRRAERLLQTVDLADVGAKKRTGEFSGGMKRRLDLALALVHDPRILFLDEPTTGLDPVSRMAIWEEVRRLNRDEGVTMFLTTQYLEEADRLADQVAIINKGRIVARGTPTELKRTIGNEAVTLSFLDSDLAVQTGRSPIWPRSAMSRGTSSSPTSPRQPTWWRSWSAPSTRRTSPSSASPSASRPSTTCSCKRPACASARSNRAPTSRCPTTGSPR